MILTQTPLETPSYVCLSSGRKTMQISGLLGERRKEIQAEGRPTSSGFGKSRSGIFEIFLKGPRETRLPPAVPKKG